MCFDDLLLIAWAVDVVVLFVSSRIDLVWSVTLWAGVIWRLCSAQKLAWSARLHHLLAMSCDGHAVVVTLIRRRGLVRLGALGRAGRVRLVLLRWSAWLRW